MQMQHKTNRNNDATLPTEHPSIATAKPQQTKSNIVVVLLWCCCAHVGALWQ
jgi:hypothetical protein